jgi:two-component system, chemotaxis family, chemotaxis protein CheY
MKVLVVDDERTTRFLLRRILTMEYDCTVGEASDGVEALEMLASERYNFVLLDLRMPVMGGMETLRVLRGAGKLAHTPVIMLTAERDEALVRQAFDLGVVDYLVKPLNRDLLIGRLNRLLRWLDSEGRRTTALDGVPWDSGPVLVVDGDAEVRAEFAAALGGRWKVLEADTGSRALRVCADERPTMVFVGDRLGVLKPHLLVRKLRGLQEPQCPRLIGIANGDGEAGPSVDFDGVVPRGLGAEGLMRELAALASPRPGPIGEILRCHPTLRANLASIAEQVFSVMTSTELAMVVDGPPRAEGGLLVATTPATWADRRCSVQLQLRCTRPSAASIAGLLLGIGGDAVDEEDIVGGLQELLEAVRSRVARILGEKGVALTFAAPTVATAAAEPLEGVVVHMQAATADVQLTLALTASDGGQAACAEPAAAEVAQPASA